MNKVTTYIFLNKSHEQGVSQHRTWIIMETCLQTRRSTWAVADVSVLTRALPEPEDQ